MSGPYPPPGQPRPPDSGGWWSGQQGPHPGDQYGGQPPYGGYQQVGYPGGQQQFGQPGQVGHDFPTVQYSGLTGESGGWGEPPRKRNTGRIVVAVVAVLVIIGGVATGIVLLNQRQQPQAAPPATQGVNPPVATTQAATQAPTTTDADDPGAPNGSTSLVLAAGACVTAQVSGNDQYRAVHKVTCGTAQSDLILAMTSPDMAGCAEHQYLRLSAPDAGVYCFTLDIKQGDCVNGSYLKAACSTAQYVVLRTEAGPGSSSSCMDATGATHWVPVGRDPVKVGCLGPTKSS
ncbi:MAG TPA: hypothetical protein VHF06_08420 [Pseudonocardiaceae bacterium]|jgi:hypothetical protein|nr:hypothetical protein [Pseudonocardiaceae bacterium]